MAAMPTLYPPISPYASGFLEPGDGQRVYWETCGNPRGRPAVVLHGGPGSGCTDWHRRLFDPATYRVVLLDQRGCGRSTPNAATPQIDLSTNTTAHLVADLERLRAALAIDRWLVLGGSWGSSLALEYVRRHPARVSGLVLFGVTSGRRDEFDWVFRGGLGCLFPEEWERLCAAVPAPWPRGDIVEALHLLLHSADPDVRRRAAHAWCLWESATPAWPPTTGLAARFEDESFRLAFSRLVIHYVRHNGWFAADGLLADPALVASLDGVPGAIVNGRFDLQGPLANAWRVHRAWPRARLVVVPDAGHAAGHPGISGALVAATDRLAAEVAPRAS
jgi:proline iminopeptidase